MQAILKWKGARINYIKCNNHSKDTGVTGFDTVNHLLLLSTSITEEIKLQHLIAWGGICGKQNKYNSSLSHLKTDSKRVNR